MKRFVLVPVFVLLLVSFATADQFFPKPGWKDMPDPVAGADAVLGGEAAIYIGPSPKSLNYYLENSTIASMIFGALYENLLTMNPMTLEFEPGLASKWSISDDKKTFTFWVNKLARWSDGRPVTAHDIKWTFDTIMDPKNLTGAHKVSLERFNSPKVIDGHTIKFTAKTVHWQNLNAAGGFHILPKHAYEKLDFNKINFELPVVSGPYEISNLNEGISLELKRRDNWWNINALSAYGLDNFNSLNIKFYAERENAFEAFKKGLIDIFPVSTARRWVKETKGEKFSKNWISKQKIHNSDPIGFQGFAMNMRRPPFNDVRVRIALAHLLDRPKMNSTIMYNQYFLHKSYYEDLYSPDNPCPNPLIDFNKDKARKLLAQAGWKVNPKTGFLEKGGQEFKFRFLTRSATSEKFLSIFGEDLKDVGIKMEIDKKDWAAWIKDMDSFNYDMTWAAWGAGLFKNPESMWSSKEADRVSGNNITGFKDPRVDELIEKQKSIFDIEKRHEICREIDRIISSKCPYILLWNLDYARLLYWNKFGMPETVFPKYGTSHSANSYWWLDQDSVADLTDAMDQKTTLPAKPQSVVFHDVFKSMMIVGPQN